MYIKKQTDSIINGCRTTKIYCRPGCPAGRRTKPVNRVHFNSPEEARANGYRACKICKPDGSYVVPEIFYMKHYSSPLGVYVLVSSQQGIVCVKPEEHMKVDFTRWERDGIKVRDGNQYTNRLADELDAYFAGTLRQFSVPLDIRGTEFQRQVWDCLYSIPYGETRSYGQVAHAIARPTASRAVGGANGSNPISIVVPCHRVIGANGKLVGYGGGLDRKEALLDLEAKVLQQKSHA